jgi:hypothetical protein
VAISPEYLFFGVFETKPGAFGGGYERVVRRCFVHQVVVFVAGIWESIDHRRRLPWSRPQP